MKVPIPSILRSNQKQYEKRTSPLFAKFFSFFIGISGLISFT